MAQKKLSKSKKIAFTIVVLLVFLAIVEIIFRIVFWNAEIPPAPTIALRYEWRWVESRLRLKKPKFYAFFSYDPHIGWRNKPSYKNRNTEHNSYGMRGAKEYPKTPAPGRKRMLVVGDSYSYGTAVKTNESYSHYLEAEYLPGWDVLNMAIPATGTDQHIIQYEQYGKQFHPDVVVMGFYVLDYNRNTRAFMSYAKPMFLPDGEGLRLEGSPVIKPEDLYEEYASGRRTMGNWYDSYACNFISAEVDELIRRSRLEGSLAWQMLWRLMVRFARQVRKNGATPVWLIIPTRDMTSGTSKYEDLELRCEQFAQSIDLPCLRLDSAFRKFLKENPDVEIYQSRDRGKHLSPQAHRLVAETLRDFLAKKGLLEH